MVLHCNLRFGFVILMFSVSPCPWSCYLWCWPEVYRAPGRSGSPSYTEAQERSVSPSVTHSPPRHHNHICLSSSWDTDLIYLRLISSIRRLTCVPVMNLFRLWWWNVLLRLPKHFFTLRYKHFSRKKFPNTLMLLPVKESPDALSHSLVDDSQSVDLHLSDPLLRVLKFKEVLLKVSLDELQHKRH